MEIIMNFAKDITTVIIVDDHTMVRQGIRAFLETQPDISIIGEAGSGEEAIQLVQELVPEVVLMDLVMPGMDGIEATRQLSFLPLIILTNIFFLSFEPGQSRIR
jgi:DNA-binding NarL/FixJ family response regulator